jgi:hypothetical protein
VKIVIRCTSMMGLLFRSALAAIVALLVLESPGAAQKASRDYKDVDLAKLGIPSVEVKKDPKSAFLVGGRNSTELIRRLTEINGFKITTLEAIMRPGKASSAGFLGKEESLLDVLAADNQYVVDELGLTHQELARHMHAMGAIAKLLGKAGKPASVEFVYHGQRFLVRREDTRGSQPSPFDDGTSSGSNVEVKNLDNGKSIRYGLLVPFMVERYGFYEGKGTTYRVEPRQVIEVFGFLRAKARK